MKAEDEKSEEVEKGIHQKSEEEILFAARLPHQPNDAVGGALKPNETPKYPNLAPVISAQAFGLTGKHARIARREFWMLLHRLGHGEW